MELFEEDCTESYCTDERVDHPKQKKGARGDLSAVPMEEQHGSGRQLENLTSERELYRGIRKRWEGRKRKESVSYDGEELD